MARCAIATAGGAAVLLTVWGSAPAQADTCRDIGRINRSIQQARAGLDAALAHDRDAREMGRVCPLARQIDQGSKRMAAVIDADPRHCGVPPATAQRLRDAVTRYYLRTGCPYAP